MENIATLLSRSGWKTGVMLDPRSIQPLADRGMVDVFITATEDGFSPLGSNLQFLAADLGVPGSEIKRLADWNRFENDRVSLIAFRSRHEGSRLKGVILAACETSKCYRAFAEPVHGKPYRDFFYNVTYEAIAHAVSRWAARRLALSHLSACNHFHQDVATCSAEALAHFCDEHVGTIESLVFSGCCITMAALKGIERLNLEGDLGNHRPVTVEVQPCDGHELVHIEWNPRVR